MQIVSYLKFCFFLKTKNTSLSQGQSCCRYSRTPNLCILRTLQNTQSVWARLSFVVVNQAKHTVATVQHKATETLDEVLWAVQWTGTRRRNESLFTVCKKNKS